MTNEAWAQGMRELLAAFPDRDLPESVLEARGDLYRREMNVLSDESWLFVVAEAIRTERWFPAVATLLDLVKAPGAPRRLALPERTETPEEARAIARRGVEMIRAALSARGIEVSEEAVKGMEPVKLDKESA